MSRAGLTPPSSESGSAASSNQSPFGAFARTVARSTVDESADHSLRLGEHDARGVPFLGDRTPDRSRSFPARDRMRTATLTLRESRVARAMRVVALLATYNEERFVAGCIEHLRRQGIETYPIDNESTDGTIEIAGGFDLAGFETAPRSGVYAWRPLLERKEALAATLAADWFVHLDADEIRLSPRSGVTLAEAIAEVDALGYNAVTSRSHVRPDEGGPRSRPSALPGDDASLLRLLPRPTDRLNAWKRQDTPVELAESGGHRCRSQG